MTAANSRHRELMRTWSTILRQMMEIGMTTYEAATRRQREATSRTGPGSEQSREIAKDLLQSFVLLLLLAAVLAVRIYVTAPI